MQFPGRSQRVETGVVSGQLRSPNGTPAVGVRVAAVALPDADVQGGALVSLAETDKDGRYRLENILPGPYYIQAGLIDTPNFYPGVSTMSTAATVRVTAGATVSGMDFTMTRAAGVRVFGRVPLTIDPKPTSIRLVQSSADAVVSRPISSDGTFEFLRVAPGTYTMFAEPLNALPSLPISVGDSDVAVGLPSGPGVKVSGVVGLGTNSPRPANLHVILTGSGPWAQTEAAINQAGEFEFPSIPAGLYAVRTIPGSPFEISKLTVADRDIRGFAIPALVELSGRATFDDGSPLPVLPTALMLEARPASGASFATAAGHGGTFRIPILEGEYRFAVGALPTGLTVKSLSYGSTDLLSGELKLDGAMALSDIRLVLGKR